MSGFALLPQLLHASVVHPPALIHDEHPPLPHVAFATHDEHAPTTAPTTAPEHMAAWGHVAADVAPQHPVVSSPHQNRDDAVDAQVRVSDVDAAIERRAAAGRTQHDAQRISDTATSVENALATGKTEPGASVEKHGNKTVETHVGADGKPDKITTVERQKDGTVKVTTEIPGHSATVETERTENGTTTVDETTYSLKKGANGAVTHKKSVTDGNTTTVDEQSKSSDGTAQLSHDQWTTQQGTHGIRSEVADGFAADGATEVHNHSSATIPKGDLSKMTNDDETIYSQGNHRVTRDKAGTLDGSATSWTQEVQNGDDYHAQTTIEGKPNELIQVSRHADRASGTVTENTAETDPVAGTIKSSATTTRGYDDEGRLTTSDTVAKDKDGTTTTTDFSAHYTDNPDGTTKVAEDTTTEVKKHGQPTRKTDQHVDALDTKDGRRVDHVHSEIQLDGTISLVSDSDGTTTTIVGPTLGGKASPPLTFKANGEPADDLTAFFVQQSPIARDVALAGFNAVQSGAKASAVGVPLVGAFADHAEEISGLTKFLTNTINPFGGIGDQLGFQFLTATGFGGDAGNASANVHSSDALRLAEEGTARVGDILSIKTIDDARKLSFDADAIAKLEAEREATTLGKLGTVADVLGAAYGAYQTGNDIYEAFHAKNSLDRTDAIASAVADGGATALAAASLFLEAGPPGWVVAAATLALEAGATEIHNIDDDLRRGHPEEAFQEQALLGTGGLLPALGLHLWFQHEDSDELRHHDLNEPVAQIS